MHADDAVDEAEATAADWPVPAVENTGRRGVAAMWARGGHKKARADVCTDRTLPYLGREWVGPPPPVCLGQAAGVAFIQIFVRAFRLGLPAGDAVSELLSLHIYVTLL
jgi:hypothetical protein